MDLISAYANGVSELTRFSHEEEQPPLVVDVIVNPRAGFFKSQAMVARQIRELEKKLVDLRERAPRRKVEINRVHYTEHVGHARLITEDLLDAEATGNSGMEHLLIGCGGDGTSNEICTALVHADGAVLERLKLLRLPLGTGNDVADAHTFSEAYDLILGSRPVVDRGAARDRGRCTCPVLVQHRQHRPGRVHRRPHQPVQAVMPGDAYKSLVDIGSLFYEQKVKPLPIDIRLQGDAGETRIEPFVPSMVVVGISGGRTYGGHLPCCRRRQCLPRRAHGGLRKDPRQEALLLGTTDSFPRSHSTKQGASRSTTRAASRCSSTASWSGSHPRTSRSAWKCSVPGSRRFGTNA